MSAALIVIPTLGNRGDYLRKCIESIANQSWPTDIVIVCPPTVTQVRALADEYNIPVFDDPGTLSGAINLGVERGLNGHEFVSWLGDDDTLTHNSIANVASTLLRNQKAVCAFGRCQYVDARDTPIAVSRAGILAPILLPWGPNLLPQPGMLVRTSAWQQVGGLDESLHYAMDLDLFLKLRQVGKIIALPTIVSTFRWHPDSLTVSGRSNSISESESVKHRYLPAPALRWAYLWEWPVREATTIAARVVEAKAQRNH